MENLFTFAVMLICAVGGWAVAFASSVVELDGFMGCRIG